MVYLSVTGNNANTGKTPTTPVATLTRALQRADEILSSDFAVSGVTINAFAGTYSTASGVSMPAYGVSIEPYRDPASPTPSTDRVIFRDSGFSNLGMIQIDRALGPLTAQANRKSTDLVPSSLRGLTLQCGTGSTSVIHVQPSLNATGWNAGDEVEVEIHQCVIEKDPQSFTPPQRGITLDNSTNGNPFLNVVSGNTIRDHNQYGIWIDGIGITSDLVRANHVVGGQFAIAIRNAGGAPGNVRPRVFCNFVRNAVWGGVFLNNTSAEIISNTIANISPTSPAIAAGSILGNYAVGNTEQLTVANNILFSPTFMGTAVPEVNYGVSTLGSAPGTEVYDSNDVEAVDVGTLPATAVGTVGIVDPLFISATDLHLTDASPSIANVGNDAFVLPPVAITIGSTTIPANINLDVDDDPRTQEAPTDPAAVLHRGADQHIADGIRLRYDTAAPLANQADAFGNVVEDASGNSVVDLRLDLPANCFYWLYVCDRLSAGPALEHGVLPIGGGSFAIELANSVSFSTISTPTAAGVSIPITANFGAVVPNVLEAELYLQAFVLRTNLSSTWSNRIRVDFDER